MKSGPKLESHEPFLPTRPPRRTLETREFWDACAEGRWLLPKCDGCREYFWYPRRTCPFCGSLDVPFVEGSGRGTVYSFTVIRTGSGPFGDRIPYVMAMIELEEGPIVLTNIVGIDSGTLAIGDAVVVVFEPVLDASGMPTGDSIYRFRLSGARDSTRSHPVVP